jgi:hypothetical protein
MTASLLPPTDINERSPRSTTIRNTATFYRFYPRGKDPIYFDHSKEGRLNSPDASFGVLYVAKKITGAFAETFLRQPGRTLLAVDFIEKKALVFLRSTRALRVANLYGRGLTVLGATAEITSSPQPYGLPQAWSAALRNHPGAFDGIAYRAKHDNDEICYALFDRSAPAITEVHREEMLLDTDSFCNLLDHYSVGISPKPRPQSETPEPAP